MSVRSGVGIGPKVYDPIMLGGLSRECAVEVGSTIGLDLSVQVATDLKIASGAEFEGRQMGGAGAQTVADVVASNHQVATIVGPASHDDTDVRVVRIPVIDSDPIEPGAEIPLGLRHQVTRKRPQIWELLRILRGHDEPEMMPVGFAATGEGAVVGIIVLGIEHLTRSAVLRDAFPPQIGQVSAERRSPGPVPYDARLDGNAARPVRHRPRGSDACRPAAAEGSAAAATSGSTLQSTGLLGCR